MEFKACCPNCQETTTYSINVEVSVVEELPLGGRKYHTVRPPYNLLAAGRRAANYVKNLPPRIEAKDGRTLEDGGDTSFPNH